MDFDPDELGDALPMDEMEVDDSMLDSLFDDGEEEAFPEFDMGEDGDEVGWFDEEDQVLDEDEAPDWLDQLNIGESDSVADGELDFALDSLDFGDDDFDEVGDDDLVPAGNLDDLLDSFEDGDYSDTESSRPADLDALFDEALTSDEDQDGFLGEVPEWLQDVTVTDDDSSAAALLRNTKTAPSKRWTSVCNNCMSVA